MSHELMSSSYLNGVSSYLLAKKDVRLPALCELPLYGFGLSTSYFALSIDVHVIMICIGSSWSSGG